MLNGRVRIDELARLERCATIDELAVGQRLERFAEFAGRVHDQRLERDDRC
jgi:hypothetical protein